MPNPVTSGLICELHYTTLSNGAVATWADQSGSGNDFIQGTAGNRPTKDATGVLFDGTSDVLTCNGIASTFSGTDKEYTIIIAARPNTVAAGTRTLFAVGRSSDNNPLCTFRLGADKMESAWRGDAGGLANAATSIISEADDTDRVFSFTVGSKTRTLFSNGAWRISECNLEIGAMTIDRVGLGALVRAANSGWWSGYIFGVAIYSRALSTTERNDVEAYFAGLYSITGLTTGEESVSNVPDAFASWWSVPRAVKLNDNIWVGGIATAGNVLACKLGPNATRVVIDTYDPDDHNTPGILAEAGKPPVVFTFDHQLVFKGLRWRKGSVNEDFTSLGAQQEEAVLVNASYAQPFRNPGTDEVVVFQRLDNRYWGFYRSTDYCDTFAAPVNWVDFGLGNQGYMAARQMADGSLRVALYGHPVSSSVPEVYFCNISLATGSVTKMDGTVLGNLFTGVNLPISQASMDLVYDPAPGTGTRLFDISDSTNPEICFATWTSASDAVYQYARWNGSAWVVNDVVAAGLKFGNTDDGHYHGGMSFPEDSAGGVVFISREDTGTWTIEKCVTADNGANWTRTVLATSASRKLIRPYALASSASPFNLVYVDCATYGTDASAFENYSGDLAALLVEYATAGVNHSNLRLGLGLSLGL